jgi:hypothetical protein
MNSPGTAAEIESDAPLRHLTVIPARSATTGRTHKVLLHGLEFFCQRLPVAFKSEGWDIRHHKVRSVHSLVEMLSDLRQADLVFRWGSRISYGKFLRTARLLGKEKIVFFWAGSDVLGAQTQFLQGIFESWIAEKIHWAGAPWLCEEIRAIGLKCEFVPITWVPVVERPQPLPERFSVLAYLPTATQAKLYGLERILHVARSLPHISFELIGLTEGQVPEPPSNLHVHGRLANMEEVYQRTSVYWRPVAHDGLSFMALEAMSHGRHVIWSYPFPHCHHSTNIETDRAEIMRLHALHERKALLLNEPAISMVSERFCIDSIRGDYLRRWEEIILSPASSK